MQVLFDRMSRLGIVNLAINSPSEVMENKDAIAIKSFYQTLLAATVTTAFVVTVNSAQANSFSQKTESLPNQTLISVEFKPPGETSPETSIGGGSRGEVQFKEPNDAIPNTGIEGGNHNPLEFKLPNSQAPSRNIEDDTQKPVEFIPPSTVAPTTNIDGSSQNRIKFNSPPSGAIRSKTISGDGK